MAEVSSLVATVDLGGRQYRVRVGDRILVNRLAQPAGEAAVLGRVLAVETADGGLLCGDAVAKASVSATIDEHLRGEKIRVFKMRRRKSSRRTNGHRQDLTRVTVKEIKH